MIPPIYLAVQWRWFAQVNALCNLSCKKSWDVATSLPGWFLSRRCFKLCITKEVEPRIAKQCKCHHCCSCKNYQGKGMEGGEKSVFALFFGWPEDRDNMEKMRFGASYSMSNKLLLVARHILTTGLQKCKSWQCKICQFTVIAFHCEESTNQKTVKAAKGLKRCWAKVKGDNNPAWTAK